MKSTISNPKSKDSVSAWVDQLTLPTYPVHPPEPNPMFFEKRNIQGAAGNIYPNPCTDRLSSQKVYLDWEVVYLENEYIQMIMMPALGGRVFAGLDKTNGYDFFYRQRVIKPALIGLFGPWISGGVEFNWPQHHRPSTFMPVEYYIEESEDGSKTLWMSEHEPMNRMKGMVGNPIRVLTAALAYRLWRTGGGLPRYEEGNNAAQIQSVGIPGLAPTGRSG